MLRPDLTPSFNPNERVSSGRRFPVWFLVLAAVAGLGLAGWKVLRPFDDGWLHDVESGLTAAAASERPMLVFFTAAWCPPCQELKSEVLSDPEVDAALERKYVRVKIDLTSRRGPNNVVAGEHGVTGIPTMILFDSHGQEIDRATGGDALAYWILRKTAG